MTAGTNSRGQSPAASGAARRTGSQAKKGGSANGEKATATTRQETKSIEAPEDLAGSESGPTKRPDEARASALADELIDQAGERFGQLLLIGSLRLQRGLALAIEAAEDLWAEAQSIRRGDQSHSD